MDVRAFLDLHWLKIYISFTSKPMKLLAISALFLFSMSAAGQDAKTVVNNECVRVTASSATLRGRPSLTGKALDIVSKNTQLESIAKRDVWVLVQAEDYAGWIESKWVEPCIAGTVSKTPVLDQSPAGSGASQSGTAPAASAPPAPAATAPSDVRTYTRGSRGGCYYISSSGRKVYVDHSLCN
jgi:hypothetical protein